MSGYKNLSNKDGYIDEFKKYATPILGEHANDKRYQGHGIIQPIK